MHLGPFVCLFVCLFVPTELSCFLRNRLLDWDEIFTIGVATRVECFNDNYDVIGHVVWQPCCKEFGPLYLWNHTKEKNLNLAHCKYSSWGMSAIFFYMSSSAPSIWCHNCKCRTLHLISMKIFEGHLGKICCAKFFLTSSVAWFSSHIVFFIINLQKSSLKWLNQSSLPAFIKWQF